MQIPFRKTAIALGTMAATAFAGPALAGDYQSPMQQQDRSGMMMGGGGMMGSGSGMMGGMGMGMQTMHALDLDQDQVRKMTEIHKGLAEKAAGTNAEMQELRWQLSQELRKEEPSPDAVGKIYERMAEKRKSMLQAYVRSRNEMMNALNEKQREQFRQMMQNMRQMPLGQGPLGHGQRNGDIPLGED